MKNTTKNLVLNISQYCFLVVYRTIPASMNFYRAHEKVSFTTCNEIYNLFHLRIKLKVSLEKSYGTNVLSAQKWDTIVEILFLMQLLH